MCVSESGDGEKTIIGCFIGELRLEFANDLKKSIIRSENKRILLTETRNSLNYVEISKLFRLSLDEPYASIKEKAKEENAEIYWGDETGIRGDSQHARGYEPIGKTPVIRLWAKRTSTNMISAITHQGKVRFQIYDGSMNADQLIHFMKRLIKYSKRKVFLILDNLRVHHAKKVNQCLAQHSEKIEIFYLPAYSPELNPDEYLNCDLKAGIHSKRPARNQKQLKAKVLSHMRMLQK